MNYVVIFAGGVGSRMDSSVPKQFLKVAGKPIIIHVLDVFSTHPEIDGIVLVSKKEYIDKCKEYISTFDIKKVIDVIKGGSTGQESIRNGVFYINDKVSLNSSEDVVLIHDGVRPLIDDKLISDSIKCTKENGNSIAASSAIETVITVDENGRLKEIVDRSMCRNAKAPQCFILRDIYEAHKKAMADGINNTIDSAMLMSKYGYKLYTTECGPENIKITTPNDYYMFKGMYENSGVVGENNK